MLTLKTLPTAFHNLFLSHFSLKHIHKTVAIITEEQGEILVHKPSGNVWRAAMWNFEVIGAGDVPGLYGMQHMIYVWCKAARGWNDLLVLIGCSWEFQPAETYIDTKELSLSLSHPVALWFTFSAHVRSVWMCELFCFQ